MLLKQISLVTALFTALTSFGQAEDHGHSNEHEKEELSQSITLGIGAPYSSELETVGLNLRVYYNVSPHICFGPEYSYFKSGDTEVQAFDFVLHYIIETDIVGIYPLLGSNYTIEKEEFEFEQETEEEFGIVFGGGIHKTFYKNLTAFAQYSRVELGIEDDIFALGLMYTFK